MESGKRIVVRNFRTRWGEVDIVACDKKVLVFVEVKVRTSERFGLPEEAVDRRKLDKIARVAEYFAALHPELPQVLRIDVAAVEVREGKVTDFRYFEGVD